MDSLGIRRPERKAVNRLGVSGRAERTGERNRRTSRQLRQRIHKKRGTGREKRWASLETLKSEEVVSVLRAT